MSSSKAKLRADAGFQRKYLPLKKADCASTFCGHGQNGRGAGDAKVEDSLASGVVRRFVAEINPDSRVFVYFLVHFMARLERLNRRAFGSDLELAGVYAAIGLKSIEASMRDLQFLDKFKNLNTVVGSKQQHMNAASIADATGIPRETVRRKLKLLIEMELIEELSPRKFIVKPGSLLRPQFKAFLEQSMKDVMHFINDCNRTGAIRWKKRTDPS